MSFSAESKVFYAQKGPQTEFLSDDSDIIIFGGGAGGGKTQALLLDQVRWANVRKYAGVIFRRTYPEIMNPGALWDASQEIYPHANGRGIRSDSRWIWPSKATIKFSHMQREDDKLAWQGSELANIGFDELTHFSQSQFLYMLSRNRSTCGVKPYMRGTCNPDPLSWVANFIDWWIDDDGYPDRKKCQKRRFMTKVNGEIVWHDKEPPSSQEPMSVRFIPSLVEDNPALLEADPGYLKRLGNLSRIDRARLKDGNWRVRAEAGMFFKRAWFNIIPKEDFSWSQVKEAVRYWDRAATAPGEQNPDPDWTAGVCMCRMNDGRIVVPDTVHLRGTPSTVMKTIVNTAKADGPGVVQCLEQDPGQAGVVEIEEYKKALTFCVMRPILPRGHKADRAKPASAASERGEISLVNGSWVNPYLTELENFIDNREVKEPKGYHDDLVDGTSGAYNELIGGVKPFIRRL